METIGSIQSAKALGKSAEGLRAHAQLAADLGHLGADVVKDPFKGSLKSSLHSTQGPQSSSSLEFIFRIL